MVEKLDIFSSHDLADIDVLMHELSVTSYWGTGGWVPVSRIKGVSNNQ